jgi:TonB family protein
MLYTLERPATKSPRPPQLSVTWEPRAQAFSESLDAFFSSAKPVKGVSPPYFRDTYVHPYRPQLAILASALWHVVFLLLLALPIWHFPQGGPRLAPVRIELTWYPPSRDLPPITFLGEPSKPSTQGDSGKPLPPSGADAYHPRQTILSQSAHPTHPRQTLIQPKSPPVPPKITPRMPNIVEWAQNSRGTRPQVRMTPSTAAPRQARRANSNAAVPIPQVGHLQRNPEPFNLASNPAATAQPKLPVVPAAVPRPTEAFKPEDVMAPQLGTISKNVSPTEPLNVPAKTNSAPEVKLPASPISVPAASRPRPADTSPAPEIARSAPANNNLAANASSPDVKLPASQASAPVASRPRPSEAGPVPEIARSVPAGNNLAASATSPDVKVPASQTSAPTANRPRTSEAGPPPDVGATLTGNEADPRHLIALSANPAPVKPEVIIPSGNLSARVAVSPEGMRPGVPGGSSASVPPATGGAGIQLNERPIVAGGTNGASGMKQATSGGGAAANPTTVSITGGNANSASTISGPPAASPETHASGEGVASSPAPGAGSAPPPEPEPVNPAKTQPSLGMDRIDTSASPEEILGSKRVYTLYINMPNLTSATGSWVLNFAELRSLETPDQPNSGDLTGPQPIRKVDPKYPPALMNAHVEGEVVLYAIIRRDGSVDSIQLMKGLDNQLDQNAMEALARWRFRPSTRNGVPVELEAVIHIPFHVAPPL